MSVRVSGKRVALVIVASLYAVLLLGSWGFERATEPDSLLAEKRDAIELPMFNADGPISGEHSAAVVFKQWNAEQTSEGVLPVIWLHGSPGGKENFNRLAPLIAATGRNSLAPDLPGFGASDRFLPDVGSRAHARYVLALMDELGIGVAHVVGWSNGGAVALNMADLAPDRISTITMLASVGVQETEGSGSYVFEHAKYLAGLAAFNGLQHLTPDFGFFGTSGDLGWLRNFQQTDQRELLPIMESLDTPTLILHGRHDFLTPHWGAERHHELIQSSRLVMLEASHFIPFSHTEQAAEILQAHFARHDESGVEPRTDYEDLAPLQELHGVASLVESLGVLIRSAPWWVLVVVIGVLARWRPMLAVVVVGMYVGRVDLDIGVAWVGLFAGVMARPRSVFDARRGPLGWIRTALWVFVGVGVVFLLEQSGFTYEDRPEDNWRVGPDGFVVRFGAPGLLAWLVLGPIVLHVLGRLPRRRGRQQLRAQLSRLTNHEWWPSWVLYLGVLPIWLGRVFHTNGITAFTAANPGIANGGGFVGESKNQILAGCTNQNRILAFQAVAIDGSPQERAQRALDALTARPELGGLPVIFKPDTGEKGRSVRLAKNADDVREYFRLVHDEVQIQRFDPGPCEFGVFWVRDTDGPTENAGQITGITRKLFLTLTGDGKHTLGQMVLRHPRLRCQANVFKQRHSANWNSVLENGETLRMGNAGNHAQGCKFEDGTDLITTELLGAIDEIAAGFTGLTDHDVGGLDYGRFDVRATSEEALQRGEFALIEINGVTSEPTHLYDPAMPITGAWGVLRAHWRHLYRVADARIEAGGKPLGVRTVLAMCWRARKRDSIRAD